MGRQEVEVRRKGEKSNQGSVQQVAARPGGLGLGCPSELFTPEAFVPSTDRLPGTTDQLLLDPRAGGISLGKGLCAAEGDSQKWTEVTTALYRIFGKWVLERGPLGTPSFFLTHAHTHVPCICVWAHMLHAYVETHICVINPSLYKLSTLMPAMQVP